MSPTSSQRLLAGPPLAGGPEPFAAHVARLGAMPEGAARDVIGLLEATGLRGRGGAGFPVGRKWLALAERRSGSAVVLANGAEGEPLSAKDRTLMAARPHLVIDGAVLAAEAVGASEIVFYVGREHVVAMSAMRRAVEDRRSLIGPAVRLVEAPVSYVAGEATAAVHYVNARDPRPLNTPPRMSEAGVGGRPTLVQNVESLAYAALIARFGERWYRSAGRGGGTGTALATVGGPGRRPMVVEVELGATVGEVVAPFVADAASIDAILLGGYFGTWARAGEVWDLPLDPIAMEIAGLTFGCGLIGLHPTGACGVVTTARIMGFMASASAGQCGPCVHGLAAIGAGIDRVARGHAQAGDLDRIDRWGGVIAGRGACRHPDGAAQLLSSAREVFAADFDAHARTGMCVVTARLAARVA